MSTTCHNDVATGDTPKQTRVCTRVIHKRTRVFCPLAPAPGHGTIEGSDGPRAVTNAMTGAHAGPYPSRRPAKGLIRPFCFPIARLTSSDDEIVHLHRWAFSLYRWRMTGDKISVIVTFHNQAPYVDDCLGSFVKQDYAGPVEIIVVDDASEDSTPQAIAFWASRHPNIKHYRVNNRNASASRNDGFRKSHGKYVLFIDGDDYAYPNLLSELHKALQDHPEADFAYPRFDHEDYGLEKGRLPRTGTWEWSPRWNDFSTIMNTTALMRRECVDRNHWNPRYKTYQDAQRCIRLARKGYQGVHVRKRLWYYRQTPNSVWNGGTRTADRAQDLANLKDEYDWPRKDARFTFASLISREDVLNDYLKAIPKLGLLPDTHWLVIIDTDDDAWADSVIARCRKYEKRFYSARYHVTKTPNKVKLGEFTPRAAHIAVRLRAIINECLHPIAPTPYLFMLEDDTIPEKPGAFTKLWNVIRKSSEIAYVSGVEISRTTTFHTGICWLDERDGEVVGRRVPAPKKTGVEDIGGGGWYCWIGRVHALRKYAFRISEGRKIGPDVYMVHDLVRAGHKAKVVWDVWCKHWHPKLGRYITVSEGRPLTIEYYKQGNGEWAFRILPQNETE